MNPGPSVDASVTPFDAPLVVPGDVIGDKYRIDAVVGRGGMSTVYRATHVQLEQLVAIKVLSPAALVMPEYVARLKREALAATRIRSQHVVRIFDIGELPEHGVPYLVMEHLTGADLAAVLAKRGPLPTRLAVECILHACEALAEAHALGIVHRDLKPANLFLTESVDGSTCVKVLDFGISRMTRRSPLLPLTDPGTVLGTPSYMAPEQMEASDRVDGRSDIWALGAILYELLVGRPPYGGESLPQIFMRILRSKTPRPSAERSDVGFELDQIVARCLAVEPDERFATVADLAWALSTTGVPHARDSAARISRVFDRRSAECGVVHVRATPAAATPPRTEDTLGSFWRKVAASASAALLLGAAAGFTVLQRAHPAHEHTRDEISRRLPRTSEVLTPTFVAQPVVVPATMPERAPVLHAPADAGAPSRD